MASNRLSRGVVSLAASAITAVYAAGYIHTQAADASLGAPDTVAPAVSAGTTASIAPESPAVTTTNPLPPSTARRASTSTASGSGTSSTTQPGATLKDGTYSGVGTSRRGNVQVSLSVQDGRVANVNITGATTEYPTRDILALPGQVVSRQNPQIDIVSGATYSSLAFRGAVQQALQKAQA
jgi:uncharacterized protein with FMN-binding domain